MIIKIPRMRTSLLINYENTVVALAIVYFLETIYLVTLYPAVETALKMVQFILLGCIGVIFCLQRISVSNMVIRLLIITTFALSFAFSGTYPFLKYGLVLLAGINCDISRLCRKILKTYVICLMLTILLGVAGVLPSRIVRRGYSTYGFVHSNVLAQYSLSVVCCIVIVSEQSFKLKQWVIVAALAVGTMLLTDSRTTMVAMLFLVFLLALVMISPKRFRPGHFGYYVAIMMPVFIMLFSMLLSWNYDMNNSVHVKIDEMMNGRLALANDMVKGLDVTLFGQSISQTTVESAYISGLFQFGVIPMLIELLIYMYAIKKNLRENTHGALVCLLAMAVHGYAESSTFNPYVNVALLTAFQKRQMLPSMRTVPERDEQRIDKCTTQK